MAELPHPRIDSHLHLWDLAVSDYAWVTPDLVDLYRSFGPEEAGAELAASAIDAAILVQAEDSFADTEYMLRAAATHDWIIGVVGWIPLDDPGAAVGALETRLSDPVVCGVRQLIHTDARANLLHDPLVVATLKAVSEADLAFDVPDAWPRHLSSIPELADSLPALTIVVDHLGKPPALTEHWAAWEAGLRAVAQRPNTYAKVSGLQTSSYEAAERAFDVALDAFGPRRLLVGSDWPLTVPYGGYGAAWTSITALIEGLSPAEQEEVLASSAQRAYRLDPSRASQIIHAPRGHRTDSAHPSR